jgi:hypothetical protein
MDAKALVNVEQSRIQNAADAALATGLLHY